MSSYGGRISSSGEFCLSDYSHEFDSQLDKLLTERGTEHCKGNDTPYSRSYMTWNGSCVHLSSLSCSLHRKVLSFSFCGVNFIYDWLLLMGHGDSSVLESSLCIWTNLPVICSG